MQNLYYKPSGKFTLPGIVFYLFIGVLTALILSFIYVFAVWFIPFIYINFLLTLGFGTVLGLMLNYPIKVGRIRNPAIAAFLGVIIGLLAAYIQWVLYETLLYNMGEVLQYGSKRRGFSFTKTSFDFDTFLFFLNNPGQVFGLMKELSVTGSWTIFGITVKGFFLWIIWSIEALMIAGFPALLSWSRSDEPYSELLNKWLKEKEFDKQFSYIEDPEKLRADFEKGNYSYITEQDPQIGYEEKYVKLTLFADDRDSDHIYITLRNVVKGIDREGKEKESDEVIIQNFNIPFSVYKSLLARFSQGKVEQELA